jgi:hypothetical protein
VREPERQEVRPVGQGSGGTTSQGGWDGLRGLIVDWYHSSSYYVFQVAPSFSLLKLKIR